MNYLPKEWYIAYITWLMNELDQIPVCSICRHNGKQVVRFYTTPKKYREKTEGTPGYDKLCKLVQQRKDIKAAIYYNKKILRHHYKTEYNAVKDNYYIEPNTTSPLNKDYWISSLQHSRKIKGDKEYQSDGVDFKSRFEIYVASEIKSLGLLAFYDPRVFINEYYERFADYLFFFPMFNRCVFMELLGGLDDYKYKKRTKSKLCEYVDNNFYIGRDIFIMSGDETYMPGQEQIRAAIIAMVTTMCELYIKKKSHQDDSSILYQYGIIPASSHSATNSGD